MATAGRARPGHAGSGSPRPWGGLTPQERVQRRGHEGAVSHQRSCTAAWPLGQTLTHAHPDSHAPAVNTFTHILSASYVDSRTLPFPPAHRLTYIYTHTNTSMLGDLATLCRCPTTQMSHQHARAHTHTHTDAWLTDTAPSPPPYVLLALGALFRPTRGCHSHSDPALLNPFRRPENNRDS